MKDDKPTLTSFAENEQRTVGPRSWCDTLPADIQEQIVATFGTISSRTVVRWLHDIGYADATLAKVDNWRRVQARP